MRSHCGARALDRGNGALRQLIAHLGIEARLENEQVRLGLAAASFDLFCLHDGPELRKARDIARQHVDFNVDRIARPRMSPQVVTACVCGMMLTPKSSPSTSFTVSDVPSRATEPLGAMKRASVAGTRNRNAARLAFRRDRDDFANAIDMSRDDMAAQFIAQLQRRVRD